ncbi:6386_t:CDS:2, partial [Entrophospora sp. SA101]
MPNQLTGIIIINNFKEKFTDKYKIVSGEAKGKKLSMEMKFLSYKFQVLYWEWNHLCNFITIIKACLLDVKFEQIPQDTFSVTTIGY